MFEWISAKLGGSAPPSLPLIGQREYIVTSRARLVAETEVEAARKVGALYYFTQRKIDAAFLGFRIVGVEDSEGITHTSSKDYPTHPGSLLLPGDARFIATLKGAWGKAWRNKARQCITGRRALPLPDYSYIDRPMMRQLVGFTAEKAEALRAAYKQAVTEGKDTFMFERLEYVTGYAKYLLEYLDHHRFGDLDSHYLTSRKVSGDKWGIFEGKCRTFVTLYPSQKRADERIEVERLWGMMLGNVVVDRGDTP